jgi:hypothetical protein
MPEVVGLYTLVCLPVSWVRGVGWVGGWMGEGGGLHKMTFVILLTEFLYQTLQLIFCCILDPVELSLSI